MVVQECEPSVMCSAPQQQRIDMARPGVVSLTQPFPAKASGGAADSARCNSSGSSGTQATSPKTTIATDAVASSSSADTFADMAAASSDSRLDSQSSAATPPPPAAPVEPMLVRSPGRWVPPHMRRRGLEGQALSRTTSMPEFSRPFLVDEGASLHRVSSSASVKSEKKVRFSARRQVIELPAEDACVAKCDSAASQNNERAAHDVEPVVDSDVEVLVSG